MENFYNDEYINIDGNYIHRTAVIFPNVKLGKGNWIGAYAVIGGNGEIRGTDQTKYAGRVEIGDNNVISEFVSIQRPYADASTVIGDGNIIMAHSHVGHDVKIGSGCEICTGVILGGYAEIQDGAKLKLGVTVRNRKKVGAKSIVGLGAAVVSDVPEGVVWAGVPAREMIKSKNYKGQED